MRKLAIALALSLLPIACVVQEGDEDGYEDSSEDEAVARPREGTPEALAILSLVNERDPVTLKAGTGLSTRVINGLVEKRLFKTVAAVDAVPYVGPASIQRLLAMATKEGLLAEQKSKKLEVIFSPQTFEASHTARVVKELATAQKTIDVAMYSLSDSGVIRELGNAVARGVKVRVIYDGASEDRKQTGTALANTTSGKLERAGMDVRWVNKTMHHKFAIIDAGDAASRVISGSGNWSNGAATRYDENTLFFSGYPEITKRLQKEFEHLWTYSRDFTLGAPAAVTPVAIDDNLREDPNTHATFTSPNFTPKGDTFYINGGDTVSTMLVQAIRDARTSIHVASGHLRSRPVAEALIEKHKAAPSVDIRVLLDGQEYISRTSHNYQLKELDQCVATATTDAQKRNCLDKGFLFGLEVGDAGIPVRYKYYAYRWDVSYAKQMHHKYLVIDGSKLLTGSYNLSDNAEHATFENVLTFEGAEFKTLVDSYEANFAKLWELGRREGRLDALKSVVTTGATIPLVFEPVTLEWSEVTDLKALIRSNCPEADSEPFRTDPVGHQVCTR